MLNPTGVISFCVVVRAHRQGNDERDLPSRPYCQTTEANAEANAKAELYD